MSGIEPALLESSDLEQLQPLGGRSERGGSGRKNGRRTIWQKAVVVVLVLGLLVIAIQASKDEGWLLVASALQGKAEGFVGHLLASATGWRWGAEPALPDAPWRCYEYEEGQDEEWCRTAGSVNGTEFWFFQSSLSPCGDCRCCIRSEVRAIPSLSSTNQTASDLSLFCWLILQVATFEEELVRQQQALGVGIFECEDQLVFSDRKIELDAGVPSVSIGDMTSRAAWWGSVMNTAPFLRAWDLVIQDGRWLRRDWVAKVDPDTVFLPNRLRLHLSTVLPGDTTYLQNYVGNTNLLGPLEVFSRGAMQEYANNSRACVTQLGINGTGEDGFIASCMDFMGVKAVRDLGLLMNSQNPADCAKPFVAAIHPHKDVGSFLQCLDLAKGHRYS